MALFTSAKDLPELKGLDAAEQKRIYKLTAKEAQKALGAKLIPFYLIPVVVFIVGLALGLPMMARVIAVVLAFGGTFLLSQPILNKKISELLQAQGYPK